MSDERLMRVIRKPLRTEKTTTLLERNAYAFQVVRDASKADIKRAVEKMFAVNVLSVKTINVRGKAKMVKGIPGFTSAQKKAYVTLKEGQHIGAISQA